MLRVHKHIKSHNTAQLSSFFRNFAFIFKSEHMILGVFGPWQVILIVAIVLLLFGGKKIPELMKGLGKGVKEFKDASSGASDKDKAEDKEIEK